MPNVSITMLTSIRGARRQSACGYSIGQPDGAHLWCKRHRLVVVFPCGR
jgi:hypothetical protein